MTPIYHDPATERRYRETLRQIRQIASESLRNSRTTPPSTALADIDRIATRRLNQR